MSQWPPTFHSCLLDWKHSLYVPSQHSIHKTIFIFQLQSNLHPPPVQLQENWVSSPVRVTSDWVSDKNPSFVTPGISILLSASRGAGRIVQKGIQNMTVP